MFRFWKRAKPDEVDEAHAPDAGAQAPPTAALAPIFLAGDYQIEAGLATDPGCYRETNEDCGRCFKPVDEERLARKGILTVVADGMGGHSAGEVASSMAVEAVNRAYYEGEDDPAKSLKRALHEANRQVYEASLKAEHLKGMGTTCTALVVHNGMAVCAHVGDSRLYLVRDGQIYLMTEDHSAVMEMVKNGLLSLQEARHHPDKNVILRALGSHPEVEISTWRDPFPVRQGDSFLLCSDGLYDLVEDEEIRQAVVSAAPHAACETLVSLAKQRGGYDNITVAIVTFKAIEQQNNSRPAPVTRAVEAIR